jgi:hypothetical protein
LFKNRKATEEASRENTSRYVNILYWWKDGLLQKLGNGMGRLVWNKEFDWFRKLTPWSRVLLEKLIVM